MGICILHDWSNGSGPLYTDPDQQHCNSIKCKEQPVLPDPDLCCVWYVPAIFLYTGFMDGISRNLDEAAIIDGCNNWQLLWKILFPVCKPIIATEAIFVFIYGYSELVFSMILMTDTKYFTVSRAMLNFSSAHTQEIGSQFAYVVMSVIPMIIIYIVFHKQIEKGMLSGAIKG